MMAIKMMCLCVQNNYVLHFFLFLINFWFLLLGHLVMVMSGFCKHAGELGGIRRGDTFATDSH